MCHPICITGYTREYSVLYGFLPRIVVNKGLSENPSSLTIVKKGLFISPMSINGFALKAFFYAKFYTEFFVIILYDNFLR